MRVCHDKFAPLKRLPPGERVAYYAPAREAAIGPLLDELEFVEDRSHWGYKFRFGLFKIGEGDMRLIARAMRADPDCCGRDEG